MLRKHHFVPLLLHEKISGRKMSYNAGRFRQVNWKWNYFFCKRRPQIWFPKCNVWLAHWMRLVLAEKKDSHFTKRKYRLTKWSIIWRPQDQGGLGVEVLELINKCLLSKWLFKLLSEDGMWQELIHNKYLRDKTLSQVEEKPTDSPF
jgi:hypothetical protein